MARLTDYNPEMLEKAKQYAADAYSACVGKESTACPSVAELALFLGVSRSTVYLWAKDHDEFSDILEKILAAQELQLVGNGLSGKYNSTIAKLMLTKHGYVDKAETDNIHKFESLSEQQKETLDSLFTLDVDPKSTEQSNNGNTSGT